MPTYGNLAKMMPAISIDYENGKVTLVCSLVLQYRRNQRHVNLSIADET